MANFPTNPTTGDTFHSGSNLYSWTGTAWKIVAGDRPDYGVVTFEGEVITTEGVLSLHFNNNLTDTGSSGATITHPGSNNGAPVYVTSGKFSSPALHLDTTGGGDFLKIPYSSDFQWDADFTVDFWVKIDSASFTASDYQIIIAPDERSGSTGLLGMILGWHGSNHATKPRTFFTSVANTAGSSRAAVNLNYYGGAANVSDADMQGEFNHVAICRESNVVRGWLNGIEMTQTDLYNSDSGSILTSSGTVNSYSKDIYIGRDVVFAKVSDGTQTSVNDFSCKIDELRMVKGSAEFSGATFTPPVKAHGPSVTAIAGKSQIYAKDVVVAPSSSGSELVLHLDGNLNDASGNNHTVTGNGTIAYSSSGAGGSGASGYGQGLDFDETSTHLKFSDIDIGTSDFTIEWWWKWPTPITSGYSYNTITRTDPSTGQTGAFAISHSTNWSHDMWINQYTGSGTQSTHLYPNRSFTVGNWYHWAVVRDQTQIRLYIGDAGSSTGLYRTFVGAVPYHVGGIGSDWFLGEASGNYMIGGAIDDFRITKSALYTGNGNYPLPTAPFPEGNPGSTTTELYMMDGSGTETKLT